MTKERVAQINATLGENLHRELWRRKVSQATVAKALGVTQGAVSRRLRGEAKIEAAELLIVAELLDLSPMQLLYPEQQYLVGTIEEQNARAVQGGTWLPRLDSNQQPFDYTYTQVSAPARLRIVPGPSIRPTTTAAPRTPVGASVVALADYRAGGSAA